MNLLVVPMVGDLARDRVSGLPGRLTEPTLKARSYSALSWSHGGTVPECAVLRSLGTLSNDAFRPSALPSRPRDFFLDGSPQKFWVVYINFAFPPIRLKIPYTPPAGGSRRILLRGS